ncbi:hypothetical protein G4B88_029597 [Cannabis sativa]|uniref:Disease resistance N-terminal domain-containing protein n=1 Tax=Cannabis sativa TaxID=3483 RepID=A0A7J6FZN2_CANSA|nr:hypothetical protein G4B88_029597 [Cannabis sativa]
MTFYNGFIDHHQNLKKKKLMAETVLSPIIKKLMELLAQEVNLLKGVHRETNSLKDELQIIQPFLKDAEAKLERG